MTKDIHDTGTMELPLGPQQDAGKGFGFGRALDALRAGGYVTRAGWNGKNMWLGLQVPDANSKMSLPYIYMCTAQGDLVPWLASQTDILAGDWEVLDLPY